MVRFTKKFNHLLVITHFFEEDSFLVMKLKDCLPKDTLNFMNENFNIEEWNRDKVMQVSCKGICYPARFLQFGDDRKRMDTIIDRLIKKEITVDKVPILQCNDEVKMNVEIKNEIIDSDQEIQESHLSSTSTETYNTATRELNLKNISPTVKQEAEENDKREKVAAIDDPVEKMTDIIEMSDNVNENHQTKRKSCSSSKSTTTKNKVAKRQNSETISVAATEDMEEGDTEEITFIASVSSVEKMALMDETTSNMDENHQLDEATKQRTSEIFSDLTAESKVVAGCDYCKFINDDCKFLKKQCKSLEKENYELNGELAILKAKLKIQKEKYRNLKSQMKEHKRASIASPESNLIKIGSSTFIDKTKLSMCRTSHPSLFTGDLLDVVFGKDVLSKSCVKGIKGTSKTPLPADTVKDILSFVSSKFSVHVGYVRAAIRQKLNNCHKANSKL